MGHWDDGGSLFTAFLNEQQLINEMSRLMGRPALFREEIREDRRRGFSFLVRPTLVELNNFIHLLDKLVSDSLNIEFFKGEVGLESEKALKDTKIVVRQKGTLQVLEEWLNRRVKPLDAKRCNEMIAVFKNIRQRRQKPAHAIEVDAFDQQYLKDQRQLMIDAYGAMRTLRLILGRDPAARSCEVLNWLESGKIWTR
jgi:hypothetical protein